jgi:hypothetical protein
MAARVQPYDIGCEPSPSVPAETVMQDGWKTYLLFFAVSKAVGPSGYLDDLGVAVLDCDHCHTAKFGYPNDEGMPEHPLYNFGIASTTSSVLEVVDSEWATEVDRQRAASARRIWGGHGITPEWVEANGWESRHFIVTLKEKTFECLASDIAVERYCATFAEAMAFVVGKLEEH